MTYSQATPDVSIPVTSILLIELNDRVVGSALVLVLIVGAAAGYLIGVSRQQTTTSVSTAVSATTTTTTTGSTTTETDVSTTVWTVTWYNFTEYGLYYVSADPSCVSGPSGGQYIQPPCYSFDRPDAFVFNCASEAATPQGCTTTVFIKGSPRNYQGEPLNYTVTVWYPSYNTTIGWPWNCKWSVLPPAYPLTGYAYCTSVNATAFIVSEPSPPPP